MRQQLKIFFWRDGLFGVVYLGSDEMACPDASGPYCVLVGNGIVH